MHRLRRRIFSRSGIHTFETEEETVSVDVTSFNKDDVTELILSGDHEVHLVKTDDIWTESSLPDETS